MSCCGILIIVIVVIIFAMFIWFYPIGKSDQVSGGHKVKFGDKTLHIKAYKELKRILREMHPEWDKLTVRAEVNKIIDKIISRMDKNLTDQQDEDEFIDKEIMKEIESIQKREY